MWALHPEQQSATWSVPNWLSPKGAGAHMGQLAAMGCGGHREGQADSSSSWASLWTERAHPKALANRGTLTLESFGKIAGWTRVRAGGAGRPHRFFLTAPSLATWFVMGETTPGSSLCQARLFPLCAVGDVSGERERPYWARNGPPLSGTLSLPVLEPSPRPGGPQQPGVPASHRGSLPRALAPRGEYIPL